MRWRRDTWAANGRREGVGENEVSFTGRETVRDRPIAGMEHVQVDNKGVDVKLDVARQTCLCGGLQFLYLEKTNSYVVFSFIIIKMQKVSFHFSSRAKKEF